MAQSKERRQITGRQWRLRAWPRGWSGAALHELIAAAEKVVEDSEAVGGSNDPRLQAALRVLEFSKRWTAKGDKRRP
jgi:hypothetical protein